MADHVHLLVEVDPQLAIHRLVKAIEGRSTRVLCQEFPWLQSRLPTLWTNSYFVATVGGGAVVGDQALCRKSEKQVTDAGR
jgi:putative transposase